VPFPGSLLNHLLRTIERFQEPEMSAGKMIDCLLPNATAELYSQRFY
jgi:hypothetical protein